MAASLVPFFTGAPIDQPATLAPREAAKVFERLTAAAQLTATAPAMARTTTGAKFPSAITPPTARTSRPSSLDVSTTTSAGASISPVAAFQPGPPATKDWALRLEEQLGKNPAAEKCASQSWDALPPEGPPAHQPHVAFCVTGAARTLTSPLVQHLMRIHLLEQYGGSEYSRLFMLLKATDTAGASVKKGAYASQNNSIADVERVLSEGWLKPWLAEAVIIGGSGVTNAVGQGWGSTTHVAESDETAWAAYRATKCTSKYKEFSTNEERLLQDHLGKAWCMNAIRREEQRTSRRFNVVVVTRPDLLWLRPVAPWCSSPAPRYQVFSCPVLGCDMFWTTPRRHAELLLGQAAMHRDCTGQNCCEYPEALLNYAKGVAALKDQTAGLQPPLSWYWPPPLEYHFDQELNISIERGGMYKIARTPSDIQEVVCDRPKVLGHLLGENYMQTVGLDGAREMCNSEMSMAPPAPAGV